jgi:hypothetical protein
MQRLTDIAARLRFLIPCVVAMAASTVAAQKVTLDYTETYDFLSIMTYQLVDTPETDAADPVLHDRIRHAIIRELWNAGLDSASSDPDLFVTYHLTGDGGSEIVPADFGYAGPAIGWIGWKGEPPTEPGPDRIVVDAWNASEGTMVWRGAGPTSAKPKLKKQIKRIDRNLAKLGKRWARLLGDRPIRNTGLSKSPEIGEPEPTPTPAPTPAVQESATVEQPNQVDSPEPDDDGEFPSP